MPTDYNFSHLDVETVQMDIPGWKPLEIEFAVSNYVTQEQQIFWKVKGTNHTFRTFLSYMMAQYGENYEKHFEETLIEFRDNYKKWEEAEFEYPWMEEFRQGFESFIK